MSPSAGDPRYDLLVVAADKNISQTFEGLLPRHGLIGTRPIAYKVLVPPGWNDPGVYRRARHFARSSLRLASFCLVVFDRDGCGDPSDRQQLESRVETRLAQNGWQDRAACVVIDPELENWVWSDSPDVASALDWLDMPTLRTWLSQNGFWMTGAPKPNRPKEAVEAALRRSKTPRSSAIYFQLAQTVNFEHCTDPAFQKLTTVLRGWFPPAM